MAGAQTKQLQLAEVIGRIYDAALDDTLWRGLAAQIADIFDAPSMSLHVRHAGCAPTLLDITPNLMPSSTELRSQSGYWRQNDIWVRRALEIAPGEIVLSKDMFSDEFFERSSFYQDWCRYLDIFYALGSLFPLPDNQIGGFGIHRPIDAEPFSEEQRHLGDMLLQHYRRALNLRRLFQRTALEQVMAQQALRHSGTATLVLAAQQIIVYACPAAEAILREADGLKSLSGRIYAASSRDNSRLQQRIAESLAVAIGGNDFVAAVKASVESRALAVGRGARLPLTLFIAPLRLQNTRIAMDPAVLVLIRDPENTLPQITALRELFSLTPAEAAVACALVQGHPIETIAELHGVSVHTARSQLKSVLAKTNTSRQAEAVAVILRSCAVLAP